MLHVGYRCHSVRAAVNRRSSLGLSKPEPSGSIQAALSTSRGKATATEKKEPLSPCPPFFSVSLTQITFLCHFMFYSSALSFQKSCYFQLFSRLNPLYTESFCHYMKYYLKTGLNRRATGRCANGAEQIAVAYAAYKHLTDDIARRFIIVKGCMKYQ